MLPRAKIFRGRRTYTLTTTVSPNPRSNTPAYAVVLQDKQGFTCVGGSIQQAVYRAMYVQQNCVLLRMRWIWRVGMQGGYGI
jgi:hypothetical protein